MTGFRVDVVDRGEPPTVRLAVDDDLDMVVETALVDAVETAIRAHRPGLLVLDLTAVPFVDSSGLRGLLRSARVAEDCGVRFRLAVVPGVVTLLLDTAGVRDWFDHD